MRAVDDLLERLGLDPGSLADGDLEVRTPITGEVLARLTRTDAAGTDAAVARAAAAFERWRDVPAPRRGELVRLLRRGAARAQGRARRARHARGRQDRRRRASARCRR